MLCSNCIINQHAFIPFHTIQVNQCPSFTLDYADAIDRGGRVLTSRGVVCEKSGRRSNSAIPTGIRVRAPNEAPGPSR